LLVGLIARAPHFLSRSILLAAGEVRRPALLSTLEAFVNVGLTIALGKRFGAVGVAAGMVIPAVVVGGAAFVPVLARKLSLSRWDVLRTIYLSPLAGAIIPLALCVSVSLAWEPSGYGPLMTLVPIVTLLFAGSFYLFCLDPGERGAVQDLVGGFVRAARGHPGRSPVPHVASELQEIKQ
jgi:O-antigen/teichoic acid export membrane protein